LKVLYTILILVLGALAAIVFVLRNVVWLPDILVMTPEIVGTVSTPEGDFYVVQLCVGAEYESMLIWDTDPRVVYQIDFEDTKWWPSECRVEFVDGEVQVYRGDVKEAAYNFEEDTYYAFVHGKWADWSVWKMSDDDKWMRKFFEMELGVD